MALNLFPASSSPSVQNEGSKVNGGRSHDMTAMGRREDMEVVPCSLSRRWGLFTVQDDRCGLTVISKNDGI